MNIYDSSNAHNVSDLLEEQIVSKANSIGNPVVSGGFAHAERFNLI